MVAPAPKKNKVSASFSKKKKTPLGMPALFPRSMYPALDAFATFAFVVITMTLTGTAQQVYAGLTVAHMIVILLTDYKGNKTSLLQKMTGSSRVTVPLSAMFWMDVLIGIADMILPNLLRDCFDDFAYYMVFYGFGVFSIPLVAIVDWGAD